MPRGFALERVETRVEGTCAECGAYQRGLRKGASSNASGGAMPDLGLTMGANPIPIAAPCHRVTRGTERPQVFVGGIERRRRLDAHERHHVRTEVCS